MAVESPVICPEHTTPRRGGAWASARSSRANSYSLVAAVHVRVTFDLVEPPGREADKSKLEARSWVSEQLPDKSIASPLALSENCNSNWSVGDPGLWPKEIENSAALRGWRPSPYWRPTYHPAELCSVDSDGSNTQSLCACTAQVTTCVSEKENLKTPSRMLSSYPACRANWRAPSQNVLELSSRPYQAGCWGNERLMLELMRGSARAAEGLSSNDTEMAPGRYQY
mmetsp:Transcript_41527/g.90013  ORF Transcript_41527/g.90013 Transcript_41527/m.90013 type:complete len:226 (-) Transcript_41527:2070-2747(-)